MRVKRAWPYLIFAAVTLLVFWKFILFGHTFLCVAALEERLGRAEQVPPPWFKSDRPHWRVTDSIMLLPTHYEDYNAGLKSGELRLWNPMLFCGLPIYSNPMVHPFYPPNLILHLIFSPTTAYGLNLLLHFFFSGVAMFWALRALGRSDGAAVAGGLIWMLSGYTSMWFSTAILLGSSVWGPLALLWIVQGLERKDLKRAGLAAFAMGMVILGSHPQHALYLFIFFVAWLVAAAIRDRAFTLRFGAIFAGLSLGVGLAAILTRLDSIANGHRLPGPDIDHLYSEPFTILTHALGAGLGKAYFPSEKLVEFEFTCYAGIAAVTLAIAGAARMRFVATFAVVTLLAVFAKPLAAALQVVPILNLSPPSRWLYIFTFCMAILAARGLDAVAERPGWTPRALAAVTGLLLILCTAGVGPFRFSNGAAIETLLGSGIATAAAFLAQRRPRLGFGLCLTAILFELVPFFVRSNFAVDDAILREPPTVVRFLKDNGPGRATGNDVTGNGMLSLHGVENPAGFDAIIPAHYVRFALAAGAKMDPAGRVILFSNFRSPLLDAAGLMHLILPDTAEPGPRFTPMPVMDQGDIQVHKNTSALPRAYFAERILSARDEEEAVRLLRALPREATVVETSGPLATGRGALVWKRRESDRIEIEADTATAGVLVFSDTDYPGWEATVDGAPVAIRRANVAFRAIEVPMGKHLVEFRFRPWTARIGLIFSTLFMLLALAGGLWPPQRNKTF